MQSWTAVTGLSVHRRPLHLPMWQTGLKHVKWTWRDTDCGMANRARGHARMWIDCAVSPALHHVFLVPRLHAAVHLFKMLALASKRQPESSVAPVTSGRTDPPVHAVDAKRWPSLRHEQGLLLDTVRAPVDVEVCISWRLAAPCMGDELHM